MTNSLHWKKSYMNAMTQSPLGNHKGGFLVLGAIFVALLFGFAALGIEVGRWFAVKAEMAKAVDAASLTGATHLTNPNIPDKILFMQQMAKGNFHDGILGTDQYTTFTVTTGVTGKVTINGQANVLNTVSKALFSADTVAVSAMGAARLGGAEIVLLTDVSGSMDGQPITDLINAAKLFIDNFEDTEDRNKFGLVSFAAGSVVDYTLQTYFHSALTTAIEGLTAGGGTNTAEGFSKALNNTNFTVYTTEPLDERDDQYVLFISDGNAQTFRGNFKHEGVTYDAVAARSGTTGPVFQDLRDPNALNFYIGINPSYTGPGVVSSCGSPTPPSTKWEIFEDLTYGLHTYPALGSDPVECHLDEDELGAYVYQTARQKAWDTAAAVKAQGIKIYAIGFGDIDQSFMDPISSGSEYRFYASSSSELEGLLQIIANRLKLRLLE